MSYVWALLPHTVQRTHDPLLSTIEMSYLIGIDGEEAVSIKPSLKPVEVFQSSCSIFRLLSCGESVNAYFHF